MMAEVASEEYGCEGFNRNPLNALSMLYENRFKTVLEEKRIERSDQCKPSVKSFEWTRSNARKLFLNAVKTEKALALVVSIKQAITPLFLKHSKNDLMLKPQFVSALTNLHL